MELNPRRAEDQQKLFLLSKKGIGKSVREDYYERVQSVNRFIIGAIVLSESMVGAIRRDIRKLAPGIKVENEEVEQILRNEVLKRDVIEGDEAFKAISRVHRLSRKATKRPRISRRKEAAAPEDSKTSLSGKLLKEEEEQT